MEEVGGEPEVSRDGEELEALAKVARAAWDFEYSGPLRPSWVDPEDAESVVAWAFLAGVLPCS